MDYSRPQKADQRKQKLLQDIYTQKELQNISKELHLPATGKKSDLCQRIANAPQEPEPKPKPEKLKEIKKPEKPKPKRPFLGQQKTYIKVTKKTPPD